MGGKGVCEVGDNGGGVREKRAPVEVERVLGTKIREGIVGKELGKGPPVIGRSAGEGRGPRGVGERESQGRGRGAGRVGSPGEGEGRPGVGGEGRSPTDYTSYPPRGRSRRSRS